MSDISRRDAAAPRFSAAEAPRAIVAICVGVAFLVLNDAIGKLLTERHDPAQIIFVRNLMALPVIALLIWRLQGLVVLARAALKVHAGRGFLQFCGGYMYFSSLQHLPLAEATALVFSAPIFIAILSVPLLRERVGPWRWGAVLLGFGGVMIIVQPGGEAFQPAALLALGTAFFYALFMLGARGIPRSEGILSMMFYVNLFPMLFAAPVAAFVWVPVATGDLWLLAGMAVAGSIGLTLIAQAFRMAPASVVAPFDYTALIWAAALGWLIWGDLPASATVLGAAVIVASGVLIIWREGLQRQRRRTGPPPPD